MPNQDQMIRAARQNLAADRMFGVDFIPRPSSPLRQHARAESAPTASASVVETKPTSAPPSPAAAPQRPEPLLPSTAKNTTSVKPADKPAALNELRQRHDAECPHCTSVDTHSQTVFGEGNPDADLMFIGEAPGAEEDRTGRPFVGRAGQKLDEIIKAMGLAREDVYIANVLKSRPPDNRTPLQGEVDLCSPYLAEQIRIIEPKVIVTLGGPATKLMLDTNVGITRLRGVWAQHTDPETGRVTPIMPTFHPAYLLRSYTPDNRRKVWSDMQAVMEQLSNS